MVDNNLADMARSVVKVKVGAIPLSLLALAVLQATAVIAGPTGFNSRTSTPTQPNCAVSVCTTSNNPQKFQYSPGTAYIYEFQSELETLVLQETAEKSRLKVTFTAELNVHSACDFSIQLKGVHLTDTTTPDRAALSTTSLHVKHALEKHLIRFSFQDGHIEQLCSHPDEPEWVLNIKRGILSMFQNTMEDWNYSGVISETDISGKCPTLYSLSESTPSFGGSHTIMKVKELASCTQRRHYLSAIQSISNEGSPPPSLLSGRVTCTQTILQNKLERVECHEEQVFQPFAQNTSGARNVISQTMHLIATTQQSTQFEYEIPLAKISTLIFHPDTTSFETNRDVTTAVFLLKQFESKTVPNIAAESPLLFRELISSLRILDEVGLNSLLNMDMDTDAILLNALFYVSTPASLQIMTNLYLSGKLSMESAQGWLNTVTFIKYPTSGMVSAVMPLLEAKPSDEVLLSVSAMLNSYCKTLPDQLSCASDENIVQAVSLIASPLKENDDCSFPSSAFIQEDGEENGDYISLRKGIVALKALGNLGILPKNGLLEKCFTRTKNSVEIRLSAMEAHRRISCNMFSTAPFLQIYEDYEEHTELRIRAYIIAMKCPSRKVLEIVQNVLRDEVVNQVGSFVWTHLTNLQETTRHEKEYIRNLLSNEVLAQKFQTDARKFSRNYENSFKFSDEYNLSAGLDSNIIFTEESFLPKSIMANISLDFFGETVNFLEIGGRFTSPETLLEPIFGPTGYFPDKSMSSFLQSTRQKRELPARLESLYSSSTASNPPSPRGSIYTRIFGHEIIYKDFDIQTDAQIPNVMDESGQKWFNLKSILENLSTGKKVGFTRSTMLMDVSYSVPTMAGIPLSLSLHASSTMGLSAEGKFNVGKFMERKEIEIYGLLRPNVAINLGASLTVSIGPGNKFIQSGLSVQNVLRSSTGISTKLGINGWNNVQAEINLPQKTQQILEVSSSLVFLTASGSREEARFPNPLQFERKSCFGDNRNNFLGLKLCGEVSIPTHFTVTPPTALAKVYLEKMDDFDGYLINYSWDRTAHKTQFQLDFDTPGSRIERRTALSFVQYETTGIFQAGVKTPSKLLQASGTFSPNYKSVDVTIIDGKSTLLQLNGSLAYSGSKISPTFVLFLGQKPVAHLMGSVQLPTTGSNNTKVGNVNITLKHVTETPIRVQGNYIGQDDTSEISLALESYYITGNLHSTLKTRPSHFSTRSLLEYSFHSSLPATIDISAKLQKSTKGALSKLNAAASFQSSSYPNHSLDFSWETQTSSGFCENVGKLSLGKSTWDAHSIYSLQNNRDITELRLLAALTNLRAAVDYHVEFAHRFVDGSIHTKFIGRVSPSQEVKAKFQYDTLSKPFLHNNLTAGITWPGSEYGLSSTLVEKRKGHFDAEVAINLNQFKEMKATLSYINNSSNLKLDHLVEFRARGFFPVPLSGNVGFTVTDKQSHIGCQILIEGKKPYSSRLSTSVDYSHIRNNHKIEAKVTFNEKKYSGELLLGQNKNGSQHAVLDLFLNQHIFVEGRMTGSYPSSPKTVSVIIIPNKGNFPMDKLQITGILSTSSLNVGLDYFDDKFTISAALGKDNITAAFEWDQDFKKKILISAKMSPLTRNSWDVSLQLSTPFDDLPNLSIDWTHLVRSDHCSAQLTGNVGDKTFLVVLKGGLTPQDVTLGGILSTTNNSRYDFEVELHRSPIRDKMAASFTRRGSSSLLLLEHYHPYNSSSSLSMQVKGLNLMPEITMLWNSSHPIGHTTTTHPSSSNLLLEWRADSYHPKNLVHLHISKQHQESATSYNISLLTPLSSWKSCSAQVLINHVAPLYTFTLENDASLSTLIPKKVSLSTYGTIFSGFNHSALFAFPTPSSSPISWQISGHIRCFSDTRITSQLSTPSHRYESHIVSESEGGARLLQLVTDIDSHKSEVGVVLKNTTPTTKKNDHTLTAWGSYHSGPEKKATLSLQTDDANHLHKVEASITEGGEALLRVDSDLVWVGFTQFWSTSTILSSKFDFLPAQLTFESSHNMLDPKSSIVNVNKFSISPKNGTFWDKVLPSSPRNFSAQTVLTNMETLYSSISWGTGESEIETITVAGTRDKENEFRFDVSSSSGLFEAISGNVGVGYTEGERIQVKSRIVMGTETLLNATLRGDKVQGKAIQLHANVESNHFPELQYKFALDQETGIMESFLNLDEDYVFFFHGKGQVSATQGLLSFYSKSAFYPSLNLHTFSTSYSLQFDTGHVTLTGSYTSPQIHHELNIQGVWAEQKKQLRFTTEGDFISGLEISLENYSTLLLMASQNGKKLGEVRLIYTPTISPTHSWGNHHISIQLINQGTSAINGSIIISADPKKIDLTVTTPFAWWSRTRLYYDIDTLSGNKYAKFGVQRDTDTFDCAFDMKSFKRNESSSVSSSVSIHGFKSLRNILTESTSFLPTELALEEVEGTFSAQATWSPSSVVVLFKTPLESWQRLQFKGNFENKRGSLITTLLSCDINERHHELSTSIKLSPSKVEGTFHVQCLHPYTGSVSLFYTPSLYTLNFTMNSASTRIWTLHTSLTNRARFALSISTPIPSWEKFDLEAIKNYTSPMEHETSITWKINNGYSNILGYSYLNLPHLNSHSLLISTPIPAWEEVFITLAMDDTLSLIHFLATTGQDFRVSINTTIDGSLTSNISSPSEASLRLSILVESPFESYKEMRLLTQYSRTSSGEHSTAIEYARNQQLLKLNGHFVYNPRHPHAINIALDLSSWQNVSSQFQATLSIDPTGNNSFVAAVVFNELKHEVHATLDLSGGNPKFGLKTTLPFLKVVGFSFNKSMDGKETRLHGLWEGFGSGQMVDVKSILVTSGGWGSQRLNLSLISPFQGLRHIFVHGNYDLSNIRELEGSFLFENEDSRWLGKLEGDLNGKWHMQIHTPIKGWQDLALKLRHNWQASLKSLNVSIDSNSARIFELDAALKPSELLIGLDSNILARLKSHSLIKWGPEFGLKINANSIDTGTIFDANIQSYYSTLVSLQSAMLPEYNSRVEWKLSGSREEGSASASLINEAIIGSRSIRTSWKAKDWKQVKFEGWLRVNNNPDEIGGKGRFTFTSPSDTSYQATFKGNWAINPHSNHSVSMVTSFTKEESPTSYSGVIDVDATSSLLSGFHASANLTVASPEVILSLDLPFKGMKPIKTRISLQKSSDSLEPAVQFEGTLNLGGDEKASLYFGYELPSAKTNNMGSFIIELGGDGFRYGFSLSGNATSPLKGGHASVTYGANIAKITWSIQLPSVISTSVSLTLAPSDDPNSSLNTYYFILIGYFDPSSTMRLSVHTFCKDETAKLDLTTTLAKDQAMFEGRVSSSHPSFQLDHRYHVSIKSPPLGGKYTLELSAIQGDAFTLDFIGDVTPPGEGMTANGKLSGSFGSIYGHLEYSNQTENDHEVTLTLESPSLLTSGKKVVIRGELGRKRDGFSSKITCRTRTSTHTVSLAVRADPVTGGISFALNSPTISAPSSLELSWSKEGSLLKALLHTNFASVANQLDTFLDLEHLEGRLTILSPLIPSSHFDVHLKSLISQEEIHILGDVHIRAYHWRCEGALKYHSWRDMVVLFQLLTPHKAFDRLTLALKSGQDEIYGEIYTPIISLPNAMVKITGFKSIQEGNWDNLKPAISVGLPFGKYSLSGIYTTPSATTPGAAHLSFHHDSQIYTISTTISPLSHFILSPSITTTPPAQLSVSLTTPLHDTLPNISLSLSAKVRGRNLVDITTSGTLNNSSVCFSFLYNSDNSGSPTLTATLTSPFPPYTNVSLSVAFDTFSKIGTGRSLHVTLQNPEWMEDITLNADYRYEYTSFLTMDGEFNAALESFMDLPTLHFALKTDTTQDGFSGGLTTNIGSTPASLKVELTQVPEQKGTLFLNASVGEDCPYNVLVQMDLLRHQNDDTIVFSSLISIMDSTLLSAHSTFSTELDLAGADLDLTTPWGPLSVKLTLIPVSPLITSTFSLQRLLANSNATVDLSFNEERYLGLQFVSVEGISVIELFNPIAPVSLILSLKQATPSSLFVTGEFCWDLDSPVGHTVGGSIKWDRNLLHTQAGVSLSMERYGNIAFAFNHSLSSVTLNQNVLLSWDSPHFSTQGKTGYHFFLSKASSPLLLQSNYGTNFTLLLPWNGRSLSFHLASITHPDESLTSALFQWDAASNPSKEVGFKWQQDIKPGWRSAEITDFIEITLPTRVTPLTLSSERIYRQGRFQLIEMELNPPSLQFSIFRNNTNWSNSRSVLHHAASNTMISLLLTTSSENHTFSSTLSYKTVSGSVANLTLNVVESPESSQLTLSSSSSTTHKNNDILTLKSNHFPDSNLLTLNAHFISYDADTILLTGNLPSIEINVKHKGENKLNIFGGYSHKKKVGVHLATVQGDKFIHLFQATGELTSTTKNMVQTKLSWMPDLFQVLPGYNLPKQIGSELWNYFELTGITEELMAREKIVGREFGQVWDEFGTFWRTESALIQTDWIEGINAVQEFYNSNAFYIKDILSEILPSFVQNVGKFLRDSWNGLTTRIISQFPDTTYFLSFFNVDTISNLILSYAQQVQQFVESAYDNNIVMVSTFFHHCKNIATTLIDMMEDKIVQIEHKLMAVGLFRKLIQLYNDFAAWLSEIPIQQFTQNIEAVMNIKIWDRIIDYLAPLLESIRSVISPSQWSHLISTPPLPFIRATISTAISTMGKIWEALEVEERFKSFMTSSLFTFDHFLARYLPTASWELDSNQGFLCYNQSLSALQWVDFTQSPTLRRPSEEMPDVGQLTNFYYKVFDTLDSLRPVFDMNIRSLLPPFGSYALMAGDHHYFTFDKKYFRFVGECSYLLLTDLSASATPPTSTPFSLIVNYEHRNGVIRKKSYSIPTTSSDMVEIDVSDFKVTVAGKKVELPLQIGPLFIRRHQTGLEMYDSRGFTLTCSLSYSVCTVSVSGWHFGKVGGILGTYDNEPSNDLQTPDGQVIRGGDVSTFAYSWRVGGSSCRMKNFAKEESPENSYADVDNICFNLLKNRASPLRPCFNTVDSSVFMEMCEYDVSQNVNSGKRVESACSAMNAYVTECQKNNVDVWMPPTCVRCRLEDGTALTTGENATLQTSSDRPPPLSSDNVILLQESGCISPSILSDAIKRLDSSLHSEGLKNNRYAIVGFGGSRDSVHDQPHVETTSAHVWTHNTLFKIPNDTNTPNSETTLPSTTTLYDAITYAASLTFRAGVSKNFIAVTCPSENCGDSLRYPDLLTLLVENDIKLHLLVKKEFTLKGNRKDQESSTNPIYGMDMNGVYTLKHAKSSPLLLEPSNPTLKRQINLPKDLCTPLAMESNGTRFNVKQDNKKVWDVWARRVAQGSQPSACQRCECVPDRFGSASILCHQCVSPSLWKFMEEWKTFQALDNSYDDSFAVDLLDHNGFIIDS